MSDSAKSASIRQSDGKCSKCGAPMDPDYGHVGDCIVKQRELAVQVRAQAEQAVASWSEVIEQQRDALVGEHFIVLDGSGRAYGTLADGRYKLEYPAANLVGVSHFAANDALLVSRRLSAAQPGFAPYRAINFMEYASTRLHEAREVLRHMQTVVSDAPLPPSTEPETQLITTPNGEFVIHAKTGDVLSYRVYDHAEYPLDFSERARTIKSFDIAEYRQWCDRVGVAVPQAIDWNDIGVRHKSGDFEAPELAGRDKIEADKLMQEVALDAVRHRMNTLHAQVKDVLRDRSEGFIALDIQGGHSYFLLNDGTKETLFLAPTRSNGNGVDVNSALAAADVPGGGLGVDELAAACSLIEGWLNDPESRVFTQFTSEQLDAAKEALAPASADHDAPEP